MKKSKLLILLVFILLLTGCQKQEVGVGGGGKLKVYVSFYPMEFLLDRIGGDKIELKTIVPKATDPHDFEPSLKDMKDFDQADIFIYNGLGLEPWAGDLIEASGREDLITIESSQFIDIIEGDPHMWLDPENMKDMGQGILEILQDRDQDNREVYEKNFKLLERELLDLDQEYQDRLKKKKHRDILVSHHAFGYMAKKYDFNQIAVSGISPEEEPSPKNIADLIDISKEKDLEYIFLESLSNPKSVDIISEEAGLDLLILNPLEGLTEEDINNDEDYISIMYKNLENLEKALVK